jgi:hypothetical protein
MLRQSNREAQAFCSSGALKGLLLTVFVMLGATTLLAGATSVTWKKFILGWVVVSLLAFSPFLPVYTPSPSRVVRIVKWVFLVAALGMAFHWSWLFVACLWPLAWVEWTRASIRRKLPVAEWPRQLYL